MIFSSSRSTDFMHFFHMRVVSCCLPIIFMSSTCSDKNNHCFRWTNRHSQFGTFSHPNRKSRFLFWYANANSNNYMKSSVHLTSSTESFMYVHCKRDRIDLLTIIRSFVIAPFFLFMNDLHVSESMCRFRIMSQISSLRDHSQQLTLIIRRWSLRSGKECKIKIWKIMLWSCVVQLPLIHLI